MRPVAMRIDDIKAFMTDFRAAFPDLNFWGTAAMIAEGDHGRSVGRRRHAHAELRFVQRSRQASFGGV